MTQCFQDWLYLIILPIIYKKEFLYKVLQRACAGGRAMVPQTGRIIMASWPQQGFLQALCERSKSTVQALYRHQTVRRYWRKYTIVIFLFSVDNLTCEANEAKSVWSVQHLVFAKDNGDRLTKKLFPRVNDNEGTTIYLLLPSFCHNSKNIIIGPDTQHKRDIVVHPMHHSFIIFAFKKCAQNVARKKKKKKPGHFQRHTHSRIPLILGFGNQSPFGE